jgi:hypothetical protein
MNQTIAQFLKVKDFPFIIKDKNRNMIYHEISCGFWTKCEHYAQGKEIYYEASNGCWSKHEYDAQGNEIYYENSDGYWSKHERDAQGKKIYYENSNGYWCKREYDAQGNQIYFENSDGTVIDNRPKPVVEMTLQDIADKLGVDVSQIRIKD